MAATAGRTLDDTRSDAAFRRKLDYVIREVCTLAIATKVAAERSNENGIPEWNKVFTLFATLSAKNSEARHMREAYAGGGGKDIYDHDDEGICI